MVDWGDDLKKKMAQESLPSKKENEGVPAVSASMKQAGEAVQESENQLKIIAEKKAKLLESLSKKMDTLKILFSQAAEATHNELFDKALVLWKQVLELDPQNAEAIANLELCQNKLSNAPPPVLEVPALDTSRTSDIDSPNTPVAIETTSLPTDENPRLETPILENLPLLIENPLKPPPSEIPAPVSVPLSLEIPQEIPPISAERHELTVEEVHATQPTPVLSESEVLTPETLSETAPPVLEELPKTVPAENPEDPQKPEDTSQTSLEIPLAPETKISEVQTPMAQSELDSLLSTFSEQKPESLSATPPLSSQELDQVLSNIQADTPSMTLSEAPSENTLLEKISEPPPSLDSASSSVEIPVPPVAATVEEKTEAVPESEAPTASTPSEAGVTQEEDDGAKELEAVLKEVNQTQMQALAESPTEAQTETMELESVFSVEKNTKEATAKLSQIKTALPKNPYQGPTAELPTPTHPKKNWVLALCVVLLMLIVATLVHVLDSMFETSAPISHKVEMPEVHFSTVDDTLKEAQHLLDAGKTESALDVILKIKEMYPTPSKMVEDWLRAAEMIYTCFKKEQPETRKKELQSSVVKIYEQVIDQFPRDEKIALAYFRTAECYASQGAYSRAFLYYDALIKYYPDFQSFEEAVYARAKMLLEQEKYPECRDAYLKMIKEFPQSKMAKWAELDIAKSYKMEASKTMKNPV